MVRRILLSIALIAACSCAHADQTLTLNLNTPSLSAPAKGPSASSAPEGKPKPAEKKTVKIGRVGLVTAAVASIYQSKSSSSRVYSKVKAETPLAIVREDGAWLGILMANGATGWVSAKCVKLIGYDLVAPEASRAVAASRGTYTNRSGVADADIIRTAMQYAGVPYVYGGTSPTRGMDCSAFVRSVFGQYGVNLPRTAREQAQVGTPVSYADLQPGDRLYFACKNPYPDHCGIYAGNGYFIHCSSSRHGVAIDSLSKPLFARSLVAARRS